MPIPTMPAVAGIATPVNGYTAVNITESLSLRAIHVNKFADVTVHGCLYYVKTAKRFAILFGDTLLHGNIGTIYTDTKTPVRVKDCKYKNQCTKPECESAY
jgi:hypothetical protein